MNQSYKYIDSENLDCIEQEIYDCIVNHTNKNKVSLKLKELKDMPEDDLRKKIPWKLINKEVGYRQKTVSLVRIFFLGSSGTISWKKYLGNKDRLEVLKSNSEKVYNLTYKHYVKSIFGDINSDIKSIFEKHGLKYVYLYPHEESLEKNEQSYSSEETKKWDSIIKIIDTFRIAFWILTMGQVFNYTVNIIPKQLWYWITAIIAVVSFQAIFNVIRNYFKVLKAFSDYKDTLANETKNRLNKNLQVETATSYMLEEFNKNVVKRLTERETKTLKYLKIASTVVAVIFVVVSGSNNIKDTSKNSESKSKSETITQNQQGQKTEIEKYLQAEFKSQSMSEKIVPNEKIEFSNDVSGNLSSITMRLDVDSSSIKVETNKENGDIKVEASLDEEFSAKKWTPINGSLLKKNKKMGSIEKVLTRILHPKKYNSLVKLDEDNSKNKSKKEIFEIYLGNDSVISYRDNYKREAEEKIKKNLAKIGFNIDIIDLDVKIKDDEKPYFDMNVEDIK